MKKVFRTVAVVISGIMLAFYLGLAVQDVVFQVNGGFEVAATCSGSAAADTGIGCIWYGNDGNGLAASDKTHRTAFGKDMVRFDTKDLFGLAVGLCAPFTSDTLTVTGIDIGYGLQKKLPLDFTQVSLSAADAEILSYNAGSVSIKVTGENPLLVIDDVYGITEQAKAQRVDYTRFIAPVLLCAVFIAVLLAPSQTWSALDERFKCVSGDKKGYLTCTLFFAAVAALYLFFLRSRLFSYSPAFIISMHPYFLTALASVWLARLAVLYKSNNSPLQQSTKYKYALLVAAAAVPLFALSSLRYGIGVDYYYSDYPYFQELISGTPRSGIEPLYTLMNKVIIALGGSYTAVVVVTSLIVAGFYFAACYDLSPMPALSVMLFVVCNQYFMSYNVVRQSVSMAILLFAFRYLKNFCWWKYLICVAIASLFHFSALTGLVILALYLIKLSPWITGAICVAATAARPLLKRAVAAVLGSIPSLADYLTNSQFNAKDSFDIPMLIANLPLLIIAFIVWRKHKDDRMLTLFVCMQTIAVYFFANQDVMPLAVRVSWFFQLPQIITIPILIKYIDRPALRRAAALGMIVPFCVITYYYVFILKVHGVWPYQCLF